MGGVVEEHDGEEEEHYGAELQYAVEVSGADELSSFEGGPGKCFEPDKIAKPMNYGEEGEGDSAEFDSLVGQGQAESGPPEQEIRVGDGEDDAGDDGAFLLIFVGILVGHFAGFTPQLPSHPEQEKAAG